MNIKNDLPYSSKQTYQDALKKELIYNAIGISVSWFIELGYRHHFLP